MNDWINKYHIIRRIIVFSILYCFLRITWNIFTENIALDTHLTAVYGIFSGLVTLIVKFYLQSGKDDAEGD